MKSAWSINQKLKTFNYRYNKNIFITFDTKEFIFCATESEEWNHAVFCLLLKNFPKIKKFKVPNFLNNKICKKSSLLKYKFLKNYINRISYFLKRNDKYFLSNTYLQTTELQRLEVYLRQLPLKRYPLPENQSTTTSFGNNWRNTKLFSDLGKNKIENIIYKNIAFFLPSIFLEDYKKQITYLKNFSLPIQPKVIFTTNQHFTNENFKFWAAEMHCSGTRLVVGEHGGFGVGLFNGAHEYERQICDYYFSTGWKDPNDRKVIPIGGNRHILSKLKPKKEGNGILLCGLMPKYTSDIRSMMNSDQVPEYLNGLFKFYQILPDEIKKLISVRLYSPDYNWQQAEKWKTQFPQVKLSTKESCPIEKLLINGRILVSTYCATSYLESLSANYPTIIFWDKKIWEIKKTAKPFFSELENAKVFFSEPNAAAIHLTKIWNEIPKWWQSKKVQDARFNFCNTYIKNPKNISRIIQKHLNNIAS